MALGLNIGGLSAETGPDPALCDALLPGSTLTFLLQTKAAPGPSLCLVITALNVHPAVSQNTFMRNFPRAKQLLGVPMLVLLCIGQACSLISDHVQADSLLGDIEIC